MTMLVIAEYYCYYYSIVVVEGVCCLGVALSNKAVKEKFVRTKCKN